MSAVRTCVPLAAVALVVCAAPAAAEAPVLRERVAWDQTQDESVCDGDVVPVTYDGTMTVMSVRDGFWLRVHTDLGWEQHGVAYTGRATGGFTAPPSGRATTYRIHGTAVGDDGRRVRIAEVVHAVWTDGQPEVKVEFERVDCW